MALQFADTSRNAMLDALEADWGASPIMRIRTGAVPANVAAADAGTVLATLNLPADAMAAASGATKAKSGTWQDASADASGTAAHFRIYTSGGVCKLQGTVTITGGGGDMTVDSVTFTAAQDFTVTGFTLAIGGA